MDRKPSIPGSTETREGAFLIFLACLAAFFFFMFFVGAK
jgi:hypothetical protein